MSDNIKVVIRIRPLIQREEDQKQEIFWQVKNNQIWHNKSNVYIFDHVYPQPTTTEELYNEIAKPIVESTMEGFNGTIFAYGQTASGKTFTMMGNDQNPGIIPRVVADIFNTIERTLDREFLIRISYLEIYNENVCDLLGDPKKHLEVREDAESNVFVHNLKEELVNSMRQIMNLMKKGEANRHFGKTNMNEKSSRSHTVFRIIIESRQHRNDCDAEDGVVMVSQLNLVDLAGSENGKQTGASGSRLTEGGFINKSLFNLGQVISQLSDNAQFISYRDSRLTRILKNSLGGNAKTVIICNITLASLEETHSTLRFATNAKCIKNKPVQNEVLSDQAMLQCYKIEMQNLQKELLALKAADVHVMREQNVELHQRHIELQKRLAEKEQQQRDQEEKMKYLKDLIVVSSHISVSEEQKKKRRETWCPGKGRTSLAPAMLTNIGITAHTSHRNPFAENSIKSPFNNCSMSLLSTFNNLVPYTTNNLMDNFWESVEEPCSTIRKVSFATSKLQYDDKVDLDESDEEVEKMVEESTSPQDKQLQQEEPKIELKSQIATENKEVDNLNQSIDVSPEIDHNYEVTASETERQIQMLQDKLDKLTEEKYEATELSNCLMEQLHEAKQQLQEENQKCAHLCEQMNQMQVSHNQLQELHDFMQCELDLKNESIIERQFGTQLLDDLNAKVDKLEKTVEDSEIMILESRKALSMAIDEKALLHEELVELQKKLAKLENEKTDFDAHLQLEREKFKHRELELTQRLEEIYSQEGIPPAEQAKCSQDHREISELRAKIEELQQEIILLHSQLERQDAPESVEALESEKLRAQLSSIKEENERLESVVAALNSQLTSSLETSLQPESMVSVEIEMLKQQVRELEEEKSKLESQNSFSPAMVEELATYHSDLENAYMKITELEAALDEAKELENHQCPQQDSSAFVSLAVYSELQTKYELLEKTLSDLTSEKKSAEEKIKLLENEISDVNNKLTMEQDKLNEFSSKLESANKDFDFVNGQQLKEEQKKHRELQSRYDKLLTETQKATGQILSDANQNMDKQRRIDNLEKTQHEMVQNFSRRQQELQQIIDELTRRNMELDQKLQKAKTDVELAEHKMKKTEEEKESLKQELKILDDIKVNNETVARNLGHMDPDKMADRIRKLSCSLDLTSQQLQKFEAENKKLKGFEQKVDDIAFERNNLRRQLREVEHTLQQKNDEISKLQQRYGTSHTVTAELQLQLSKLQDNLEQARADRDQALDGKHYAEEEKRKLEDIKTKLEQEMRGLAAEVSQLRHQIEELRDKNEEFEQQLIQENRSEAKLEKLKQQYEEELRAKLEENHNYHEAIMDRKLKEEREKYEERLQVQICELRDTAMQKMEEEKLAEQESYAKELNKLKADYELMWEELQKSHAENLENLKEEKDNEKEELEKEYAENVRLLVKEREEVEKQYSEKICQIEDKHSTELMKIEESYKATINTKEAIIQDLMSNQEGQVKLQRQRTQLQDELEIGQDGKEQVKTTEKSSESEVKKDLILLTQQCNSLKDKLAETEQKYNDVCQTKEELEQKLIENRDKLAETEQKYNEVCQAKEELEQKLSDNNDKLAETEQKYNEVCHAKEELEQKLNDNNEMLSSLHGQVEELAVALQSKIEQITFLEEVIEEAKQEATSEIESLQEEIRRLEQVNADNAKLIKKYMKDFKEQKEYYESQIKHREKCCDEADTELEDANKTICELEKKVAELVNKAPVGNAELIKRYKEELDEQREYYESQIKHREKCCDEADKELEDANKTICELEKKVAELVNKAPADNAELIKRYKKELDEQREYYESQIKHREKCCDEADTELEDANKTICELEKKVAALVNKAQGNPALQNRPNSTLAKLEKEKHDLEQDLVSARMKIAELEWEAQKECDPLKESLQSFAKENKGLRESNWQMAITIRNLKRHLQEKDASFLCTDTKSNEAATDGDSDLVVLKSVVTTLEREKKSLQLQLNEISRALDTSHLLNEDLKQRIAELDQKNKKFKKHFHQTLTEEDRAVLNDMVNSPKVPNDNSKPTENQEAPKFFSEYLTSDVEDEQLPECKTQ